MISRIVLADSSDIMLLGFQTALYNYLAYDVVARLRSYRDMLGALPQLEPDVLLLNERLDPLIDVLALVEQIKPISTARLVIYGSLTDGLLIRDLFAVGVLGYLYLGDDLKECLVPALKMVMTKRPYLSPTVNAEYLIAMQSPLRDWRLDADDRKVLRLLVRGLHVSQIAREMNSSLRRIYWIRQKLRNRFGATTNEHLIHRAVAEGFVSRDE